MKPQSAIGNIIPFIQWFGIVFLILFLVSSGSSVGRNVAMDDIPVVQTSTISEHKVTESNEFSGQLKIRASSPNKVYAYFNVPQSLFPNYRRSTVSRSQSLFGELEKPQALLWLSGKERHTYTGYIEHFETSDNQASFKVRAVFEDPIGLLEDGLWAVIKIDSERAREHLLVDESAIRKDVNNHFVLVVDNKNVANYRVVRAGKIYKGFRVVHSGLKKGERVILERDESITHGTRVKLLNTQNMISEKLSDEKNVDLDSNLEPIIRPEASTSNSLFQDNASIVSVVNSVIEG